MRLLRSLRKRYYHLARRPDLFKRHGATLLLSPHNHVDFRLAASLPFEDAQLARAQKLIQSENLSVLVDIGANIGLYSVVLGRLPSIRQVYAFEPVRANFNQLSANIFLNGLDTKIDARRLALGSLNDRAIIHVEPTSTGRSRLDPGYSGDPQVFVSAEQVEIKKGDDELPFSGERVFIKLDVEGHAVEALLGLRRFLSSNEAIIQAELLEFDRQRIIDTLINMGYVLFDEVDVDGYFRRA